MNYRFAVSFPYMGQLVRPHPGQRMRVLRLLRVKALGVCFRSLPFLLNTFHHFCLVRVPPAAAMFTFFFRVDIEGVCPRRFCFFSGLVLYVNYCRGVYLQMYLHSGGRLCACGGPIPTMEQHRNGDDDDNPCGFSSAHREGRRP